MIVKLWIWAERTSKKQKIKRQKVKWNFSRLNRGTQATCCTGACTYCAHSYSAYLYALYKEPRLCTTVKVKKNKKLVNPKLADPDTQTDNKKLERKITSTDQIKQSKRIQEYLWIPQRSHHFVTQD